MNKSEYINKLLEILSDFSEKDYTENAQGIYTTINSVSKEHGNLLAQSAKEFTAITIESVIEKTLDNIFSMFLVRFNEDKKFFESKDFLASKEPEFLKILVKHKDILNRLMSVVAFNRLSDIVKDKDELYWSFLDCMSGYFAYIEKAR